MASASRGTPRAAWIAAGAFAIIGLTIVAYWPGMTGGFAFDDYPNIVENRSIVAGDLSLAGLKAVIESGVAGPLKRPIPMLSFAVNYHFAGLAPYPYKLVNLIIHLLNGLLVASLVHALLRTPALRERPGMSGNIAPIALLTAGLWLVHPLNLTSVLFIVQRMNSLAAGFTLLALIAYCAGRERIVDDRPGGRMLVYAAFPLIGGLGVLCKENAVLVVPLAVVVEWCFFRFKAARPLDRKLLTMCCGAALALPLITALVFLATHPGWLTETVGGRGFSPLERGWTEARVLFFYLAMLFAPRLNELALYHDDILISSGWLDPPTTLIAFTTLVVALLGALAAVRRFPLVAFPVLWFFFGHALESSIFPLELVHEHRNYLPGVGICFGLACAIVLLGHRWQAARLTVFAGGAAILVFGAITFIRAGDWSDPVTLALVEAERNPDSFRTVYELGRAQYGLYLMHGDEQNYRAALATIEHAAALDSEAKRPLLELIKIAYRRGVVPRPDIRAALLERYATALFRHNDWVDLQRLADCRARPDCPIPHALIIDLYAAALSNDTVTAHARARLMSDFAVFYVNVLGDLQPAIALLDDAIALRPAEIRYRVLLIDTLVLAHDDERALAAIAALKNVPAWGRAVENERRRIAALQNRIERRQTAR